MARTLTEIYTLAKDCRNQYLELTEIQNSSKMSILDAITWITASCIWTFENLLDVFKIDIARDLQNRINGNAAYYANALLKYQRGDELEMNAEGTAFSYPNIDEKKRIVTKVSYSEFQEEGFYDKQLMLKIATGDPGDYERVSDEDLLSIRDYMNKIAFAGTHTTVVSRNGDILIPRVTVYHDGAISEDELYKNIEESLNSFVSQISFDGVVYTQRIIDAIQKADHVLDVYVDTTASSLQGIFVARYDDDNNLIPTSIDDLGNVTSFEQRIDRSFTPHSGFLKQSSRTEAEVDLQTWKEALVLKIETK